jgi:hypothetical protein
MLQGFHEEFLLEEFSTALSLLSGAIEIFIREIISANFFFFFRKTFELVLVGNVIIENKLSLL